ncbi:regulator of G-protein signaling 9-binding protein [Dasypus novemcinctus]|uniref:regulator of G-protein signaling 9-binding protein n=1 Tax=Dasypus novemcinctus TaxID=9361 RepID=UPI0000E37D0E|nr:regulator of G-protein signaling 9-binding protein [Dasypus novemcinctus]
MAREECQALLDALHEATACYHHLVLPVGSVADSQNLREELQKTRQKAQELAGATCAALTAALRHRGLRAEERAEFERLWVAFSGCLDLLEADMRRALALGTAFPLREADGCFNEADLHDLERELLQVGEMIHDMEMKVTVPRWTVQARQAPGAELLSRTSTRASSVGGLSVEEPTGPCDPSKALAATVFSAVLLAAVALAVCVAKLS